MSRSYIIIYILLNSALLVTMTLLESCGPAKAQGGVIAELVPAPASGYRCFVIKNENGSPIGGNCVRE